jgi:hypothetical protein
MVFMPCVQVELYVHLRASLDTTVQAQIDWPQYVVSEFELDARGHRDIDPGGLINDKAAGAAGLASEHHVASEVPVAWATSRRAGEVINYLYDCSINP